MYVCICNGYRDSELRALAHQGVRCAHAAYKSLGNGPRCGRCLSFAQQLIDDHAPDGGASPLMNAIGG
jgi:bacterioferritin-associated ferredoxin